MENKIIHADVLDGLKMIPDGIVSLVFYSSPYNAFAPGGLSGKKYGDHDDNMPWIDYIDWLKEVNIECQRVLRTGGRLAINIDAITNRQEDKDEEYIRPIVYYLCKMMKEIGMLFYTEVCWTKQNAVGKDTAWGSYLSCSTPVLRRNHEYILVWSKDQFTLPGDDELSDMTRDEFLLYTLSHWIIPPETRRLGGHPAAFPEELVKRMVKLFTYRGDLVVDPFCGTGTTPLVAHHYGRRWIGIDNDKKFCEYAKGRIKKEDVYSDIQKRSEVLAEAKEKKRKKNESVQKIV
tara:strand:+ start:842 stop:1711 length:870 start_codon:yes stop_codon:yes gene_type:complete